MYGFNSIFNCWSPYILYRNEIANVNEKFNIGNGN